MGFFPVALVLVIKLSCSFFLQILEKAAEIAGSSDSTPIVSDCISFSGIFLSAHKDRPEHDCYMSTSNKKSH